MKKFLLLLLVFLAPILAFYTSPAQNSGKIKYVFLFIGDGMGTNQVFLTEKFNELTKAEPLIFMNNKWSFGLATTECADSNKITDSGAGGTAIACGERTSYGNIGENKGNALESIAEFLHTKKNFKVGIITSVPLTHATPASFYGHEPTRRNYDNLTNDLIESGFEFFAGGGFQFGNADSNKKIYKDFDAVIMKLKENNFLPIFNHVMFDSLTVKGNQRVILIDTAIRNSQMLLKNVYSEEKNSLPFALDFPEYKMQLAQYTEEAQNFLMNDRGFFIMVEGGKIDWACHDNDALTAIYEINAFNEAIKKSYDFYLKHPKNTLIIITADHETGGMALGTGEDENSPSKVNKYALYVNKLRQQKKSYIFTSSDLLAKIQEEAQIGWTTDEHTSAPVGVWAIGKGCEHFSGIIKNSDIKGKILKLVK
ncbi:MAG TPA: alkaline phosphatase [Bacteroidales bacterium]|nr:alkaline phosphatase [Bacteroidales bacterium]